MPAGLFGPWREPAFVIVYGETKTGKSTDAIWAFAETGIFLTFHRDGVEKSARQVVGWSLRDDQIRPAYNLTAAYQLLQQLVAENQERAQKGQPPRYLAIVMDDMSLMVENELAGMKASGRYTKQTSKGTGYHFDLWVDLLALLMAFGNLAKWAGVHVVMNAHVRSAGFDADGEYHRGGPWLPSLKQIKKLPHVASSVLKIEWDLDQPLWPAVFRCEPDASWVMGDRHGLRGRAPMNLGEWLRQNEYAIPRPASLGWIEEWASVIAQRIGEGQPPLDVARKAKDKLTALGRSEQHTYWAIRDGVHRAAFKAHSNLLSFV